MIEYADGYVYINGQGYIIDISNEKAEVPIIIGYSTEATNFILGNRLNNDDLKRLEVANRIIETANSNEILSLITKIDISNEENYAIILQSEGKAVYLGDCSDLTTKMAMLKAMLIETEGQEGEIFLDINIGNQKPRFKKNIL